jgi:hypothetical protein
MIQAPPSCNWHGRNFGRNCDPNFLRPNLLRPIEVCQTKRDKKYFLKESECIPGRRIFYLHLTARGYSLRLNRQHYTLVEFEDDKTIKNFCAMRYFVHKFSLEFHFMDQMNQYGSICTLRPKYGKFRCY